MAVKIEKSPSWQREPIPFAIEIPTVSEEDYIKTRRAVNAAIEGVFIARIRSVSIEELLAEDEHRESRQRRFNPDWVDSSITMRATIPPKMEVFIDPNAVGSNHLSTDEQKTEIAKVAARYREKLPEALRGNVDWHMVDPSTMSQVEDAWMVAGNGLLLPNFFVRTDVQTVEGVTAIVGRGVPSDRREIRGWGRDDGYGIVFAVAVGVLPRKLTT